MLRGSEVYSLYYKALWTTEIASLPEMYNILKISETVGIVDHNCNVMVYAIKRWKYLFCAVVVGFHCRMRCSRMMKAALHFLPSHLASSSSYCYHRRYMCNLYYLLFSCLSSIHYKVFWKYLGECVWVRLCMCICVCICALQESSKLHDMHVFVFCRVGRQPVICVTSLVSLSFMLIEKYSIQLTN